MKKIIMFSLMLFVIFFTNAQSKQSTKQTIYQKMTNELTRELNLKPNQSRELFQSLKQSFENADLVRSNSILSKEEKEKQLSLIYKSREEKINSILNNDQRTKYEQYKVDRIKERNKK